MAIPRFNPKELEVVKVIPASQFMPEIKVYSYPVSEREAFIGILTKKAVWQMTLMDSRIFTPRIIPDNISRSFVFEANPFDPNKGGGKDMFGMIWEYVPSAQGSMIRPGMPLLNDANEWYDKLVWPDIDSWDWEGSAGENNGTYLNPDKFNACMFLTGWYERLITFMDFGNAAVAMIDEEQKDAVKDLFDKATDLYIRIFDKFIKYFPAIDGFTIHDDWGSQKETFFSPGVVEEMIVPYMRRVTDHLHSEGKFCELHSCGQLMKQVPNIIAAGWDAWNGQAMNNTHMIYELYGDKIVIGVMPEMFDPAAKSEEEQRQAAREYANKFCNPDKPSYFNIYGSSVLTPAYREELYKQSRINYSREK
jgi:hypothetical protein